MRKIKTCANCRIVLDRRYSDRKYCNSLCMVEARRKIKPLKISKRYEEKEKRFCYCGEEIIGQSNKKYCSTKCQTRKNLTKMCPCCNQIKYLKYNIKVCSKKCKIKTIKKIML